ncbi:MAG: ATP-binding protein [Cyclobacteriaceae bacterium]
MKSTLVAIEAEDFNSADENNAIEKHNSLIHILKGFEEFILDINGVIVSSNLEAVNITGYEEREVIGEYIGILYNTDEQEKAKSDLEKAARLRHCVVTGIRRKKRGTAFWAKMKIKSTFDSFDRLTGYKVVLQDATHRALSKARVQTLRDEYLAIFNNPFIGSFKFKMEDGRILMCNGKTLEITNRKNSSNLYFHDFFYSREHYTRFITLLKSQKKVDGFKFLVNDQKSDQNWAVISARYFEGKDFAEGVLFDISEQHSQSVEIERMNGELDNFTYHASHDMRAPLTTILGLVNLGKRDPLSSQQAFSLIEERVKHLDGLLKDLTSVTYNNSRLDQEYIELNFNDEVNIMLNETELNNHEIIFHKDIDQAYPFSSDPIRIRTILRHLISNAIRYKRSNSGQHFVSMKIKVEKTHVALTIKDNGVGIDWALKGRVWDMFFRGTAMSTGSGLGLYVVKAMVDKLKGTISLESTLDSGTTILVVLPNKF